MILGDNENFLHILKPILKNRIQKLLSMFLWAFTSDLVSVKVFKDLLYLWGYKTPFIAILPKWDKLQDGPIIL